jgi:hypothetical protein
MLSGGAEALPPRLIENLGRGVVAVRSATNTVALSWRLLALDPANIGFNVYRSTNGGSPVKLNGPVLTGGTNYSYTETSSNLAQSNSYLVRAVVGGVEQSPGGSYTLAPSTPVQPLFSIPLRNISGTASDYYAHFTWVGDLDGDGEFDFVVDRIPTIANTSDKVEAYKRDGTLLWSVDMGPNSLNKNNIEPGSSTISIGHWDGLTVYDLDGDGRAEVLLRTANGVVFGDGSTLSHPANNDHQFISVLDGMTGAERARIQIPTDYLSDGPMPAQMGVGYFDGVRPSLVVSMKNRVGSGPFNMMVLAYDFDGTHITQKWKWTRGSANAPDGHQIRNIDVDQDGKDEYVNIGFVLNGGGTMKYSLGAAGTVHGDRYHIGDLDPDRPGLEGFGVQQDHPGGLIEYYYDAATGQLLHTRYTTPPADNGRGIVADIDPNHRGYEYWSFHGIHNSRTPVPGQPPVETKLTDEPNRPWPNLRIWWDGDTLSENLNRELVDKWNPATQGTSRLLTAYQFGAVDTWRDAPTFYGDIIGDWREEIIYEKSDHTALLIFTTPTPSSTRLYTLAQNPAYRNAMTIKGYLQSHQVDYYLGSGMSAPPTPNIAYVGVPRAYDAEFLFESSPNALNVRFSQHAPGLGASDIVVTALEGGATVAPTGFVYDPTTLTATLWLPTPLPEGLYRATAGEFHYDFHVLAGDADRDRDVDVNDLGILASNWQQSPRSFSQGDFDYSGTVDVNDLGILASHWQQQLAAPSAPTHASRPNARVGRLIQQITL